MLRRWPHGESDRNSDQGQTCRERDPRPAPSAPPTGDGSERDVQRGLTAIGGVPLGSVPLAVHAIPQLSSSRSRATIPRATSPKLVVSGDNPSRIESGARKSGMTPASM